MCKNKNEINTWMDALIARYPHLFDSRYPSNYGAPIGWRKIVEDAVTQIAESENLLESLRIVQIKSKFDSLRIYTNYSTPEVNTIIAKAEGKADATCMICGELKAQCFHGQY